MKDKNIQDGDAYKFFDRWSYYNINIHNIFILLSMKDKKFNHKNQREKWSGTKDPYLYIG